MHEDLEPQAAAYVGQLVFAFARLDFLLALALRNLLIPQVSGGVDPLIERLGFKERLDSLKELLHSSQLLQPKAVESFDQWHRAADKLRTTRNAFVHGRWGMQSRDTVFNASTKVGQALSGDTKIYTLAELEIEASRAKEVLNNFDAWHRREILGAA